MEILDPEIKPILEFMKDLPPLKEITAAKAREMEADYAKLTTPNLPLEKVEDQKIPGRDGSIRVRIYTPIAEPFGTVVFFHGGGFAVGSIETHDGICRRLAFASKCRVISVDYRLAPEHKFPAAVYDSQDAFEWASKNFGGKLCVAGDSAGGNLAAVVAQLERNNHELRLQVLIYPVLNQAGVEPSRIQFAGLLLKEEDMHWFGEQYHASRVSIVDPLASPLLLDDLKGLAPAVLVTAEFDPLRDQGETYAMLLRKAGVPVIGTRYTGTIHGFLSFPTKMSKNAIEAIGAFILSEFSGGNE
jgi:acetyl esterase